MQRIKLSDLAEGQTYKKCLFSPLGQKVADPAEPVTAAHKEHLRRQGHEEVLLAGGLDELAAEKVVQHFEAWKLQAGVSVEHGILSAAGQVLLEPGQTVEQHHLDAIDASGKIYAMPAHGTQDKRRWQIISEALVKEIERNITVADLRVALASENPWPAEAPVGDWPDRQRLAAIRQEGVEKLRRLYAHIQASLHVNVQEFVESADELMGWLAGHPSRFTQLALLAKRREDYLPDHGYTVAVLAMSIARRLRWTRENVRQCGVAGMLFDVGMLMIPQQVRNSSEALSDVDRSRVLSHPAYTLGLLELVDGVGQEMRLAGLQHHERENGTGYPRGLRKDAISDMARVIAVADIFAAMTEPRKYRLPKLPYMAMEELLHAASSVTVWKPAVRALVQAAGLFPVGSFVKLSDGRSAQVVGAHADQFDRPIIQPVRASGKEQEDETVAWDGQPIDLAEVPKSRLTVVRAILSAAA